MEATLTPEEQQLVDRLRAKYRHGCDTSGEALADQDAAAAARAAAEQAEHAPVQAGRDSSVPITHGSGVANVSLCPVCQGGGRVAETYHHRIIEHGCDHCSGEGVLLAGAPAPAQGSSGVAPGSHAAPVRSCGARGVESGSGGANKPAAARSHEDLRNDVRRIDERMASYSKVRGLGLNKGPCTP